MQMVVSPHEHSFPDETRNLGKIGYRRFFLSALFAPFIFMISGILISCYHTSATAFPADHDYQNLLDWSLQNGMPGAILLVRTSNDEFLHAAGYADRRRRIPMRTDHAFQIGSITKSFLGVVFAQMHAEGLVDLDVRIAHWLDADHTSRIPHADRITLRHLLEHSSGLPEFTDRFSRNLGRAVLDKHGEWTALRELHYALDRQLLFEPGTKTSYSNTGYLLAGLILAKVAGQHHAEVIRQRIIEPLNLESTWYMTKEPARADVSHGYENWYHWWWTDTTDWSPSIGGHAGLASTVSDLATFMEGIGKEDGFLSEFARKIIFQDWDNEKKWYFLGLQRARSDNGDLFFLGHSGATPGYHCFAFHQPERGVTVVFFGSSAFLTVCGERRLDNFYKKLRDRLFELSTSNSAL